MCVTTVKIICLNCSRDQTDYKTVCLHYWFNVIDSIHHVKISTPPIKVHGSIMVNAMVQQPFMALFQENSGEAVSENNRSH